MEVTQEQSQYVANSTVLLARAYAYRECRSNALLILNDDVPVGMALFYDLAELKMYDFSQIFIDQRHQGKGYGLQASKLILQLMEEDGRFDRVSLCFVAGNESAHRIFEKLGFKLTGEMDEDEIIMVKNLH